MLYVHFNIWNLLYYLCILPLVCLNCCEEEAFGLRTFLPSLFALVVMVTVFL